MLRWQMTQAWPEVIGVGHGGRLHKVVIRCVQQPVQDVAFVMSGQPDSLGQIESGQEITLEVVGFRVSSECTLESPRTTEEPCRELQCLNRLWS